jgi:PHS family inorganic phosphate transporter-like MFS transporter
VLQFHFILHTNAAYIVVPILGYLYYQDGKVPTVDSDVMKGGLSLGMVIGQLLFGVLSDVWGRHTIYGKELLLTILGTLLVILLPWKGMDPRSITAWVAIFRVLTGVGIGAGMHIFIILWKSKISLTLTYCIDYPLSSSLAAEKSPFGTRATQVLTVFSNIGLGNMAASIVFLVLLKAFQGSIAANIAHLEWVWRLLLGIGIIPAVFTLYARLTIAETLPYKQCESFTRFQTCIR